MKNVLTMHLANLERSNAELRAQTERFRLANDRLEAWLTRPSRSDLRRLEGWSRVRR